MSSRPTTMPVPVHAVLFDLDDTLYPEHQFVDGGFQAVARFVATRTGLPETALTARLWQLHERDGRGRLFDMLLDETGLGTEPGLVQACIDLYRTHPPSLDPLPGVQVAVSAIRGEGIATGVVTDGTAAVQRRKLRALGELSRGFDVIVLTDELGPGKAKPSPAPFLLACRLLNVEPVASVYVGNDPVKDFRGARDAGLFTIRAGLLPDNGGATTPSFRPADDADVLLGSMASLPQLLLPAAAGSETRRPP
jgi:putative hydrolase of the HAD superfamily